MLQTNWLRMPSWRVLGRGRRAHRQVGLYRAASELVAARVRLEGGSWTVEQLETADCITQRDEQAVAQILRTGIARQASVISVLAAEQYNTYPLPAPPVPKAELREALRWKLREVLPYAPEDAAVDFVSLARAAEPNTAESLFAVAALRRNVAQAIAPLLAGGIDVQAVDIAEMAQRNLLNALPGSEPGRALLGLEDSSALLTAVHEGALCFARRIPLARLAGTEEEDPEHVAVRVATQVQRSLEVVERQTGLPAVRTVWVGPHAYCALIARCVAEQTGLDCPQLDIQAELQFSTPLPPMAPERAAGALIAIGAALRSEYPQASASPTAQSGVFGWPSWRKAA